MTKREFLFGLMAVTGAGFAAYASYQLYQQTRRADAFQDRLNARIWERRAECRVRAARENEIWRAVAADAMRAEYEAHQSKLALEGQNTEESQ